jgi:RNA polymerase sigma factor (sigma-70 family)
LTDYCLTPLGRQMVEDNLGLVGWMLERTRYCAHLCRDDREQIGRIGLINAVAHHNPARGKFSTYASWAIYRTLQAENNRDRTIALPRALHKIKDPELHVQAARMTAVLSIDEAEYDPPMAAEEEDDRPDDGLIAALRAAVGGLTERERTVVTGYVVDGRTLASIGDQVGVTKERIRQIRDKTLADLGDALRQTAESKPDRKYCVTCRRPKAPSRFAPKPDTADGLTRCCRDCLARRVRQRAAK